MTADEGPELTPETCTNRELSWIEFNRRVLALAQDPALPLLERMKFLAIFSTNLDEFYMVRVAGCTTACSWGWVRSVRTACSRVRSCGRFAAA